MSPSTQFLDDKPKNKSWTQALKGALGDAQQTLAYERLSSYLYVVAYNCLVHKQINHYHLLMVHDDDLSNMAQDYVQQFMVKMVRDDYALLDKFSGRSKFTTWAAQVINNIIRTDMRKAEWSRCQRLDDHDAYTGAGAPRFEQNLPREQLLDALYQCLEQLPAQSRTVLVRCVMQGESAADVAQDLGRTLQAVYNLANRAKKQLVSLLWHHGVESEDLAFFS